MGVWVSWLTGEGDGTTAATMNTPPGSNARPVPVVDYITAGNWDTVTDPYPTGRGMEALMTERRISANTFALVVRGTSMEPEFREDDKVIINPDVTPQPGDFVVAKLLEEEEATLKKYRPRGNDAQGQPVIELVPLNEDWRILRMDTSRPARIIGTVIEHRRYRRC